MRFDNKTVIPDVSAFNFAESDGRSYKAKSAAIDINDPSVPDFIRAQLRSESQPAPLAHFDPGMLDAMRSDPYAAPILDQMRDQAQKAFLAAVDQTLAALPKDAARTSTVNLNSGPVSGRRLMIDSRRGELVDKSRRDLVDAMAVEAVLNLDNPDWDPARPETSRETPNLLLALLREK